MRILERPIIILPEPRVENGMPVVYPDAQDEKGPVPFIRTKPAVKEGRQGVSPHCQTGAEHFDHRAAVTAVFGSASWLRSAVKAVADNVQQFPSQVLEEARGGLRERDFPSGRSTGPSSGLQGKSFYHRRRRYKDIDERRFPGSVGGWMGTGRSHCGRCITSNPQSLDAEAFGCLRYIKPSDSHAAKELNGICSLNPPGRPAGLSALMHLDSDGALKNAVCFSQKR